MAELEQAQTKSGHLVTVRAEAGQPYVLQHYERRNRYSFTGTRPHWVSTVHSGDAADSIDATGLLIEQGIQRPEHVTPLRSQAVEIGPDTRWRRRANLLATTTREFTFRHPDQLNQCLHCDSCQLGHLQGPSNQSKCICVGKSTIDVLGD